MSDVRDDARMDEPTLRPLAGSIPPRRHKFWLVDVCRFYRNIRPKGVILQDRIVKTVAQISEYEARLAMRLVHWLIGPVEDLPLTSPTMDDRVRKRHQTEIAELTDSGFDYLCSEGQRFPLSHLLRIFPALAALGVWLQRTPIWIRDGCILFGYPIVHYRLKSSFVELDASHAKFLTTFEDGTLLVSGNYDDPIPRGAGIIRQFKPATITETWNNHIARVHALESINKQIDPRTDYAAYAQASARDRVAW